jgi:nicotinic acid mononucleotide adenylyltransferase
VVVPHLDVSSTDLRARVVDGRPLDFLVPDDVLTEIRRRRMYVAAETAHAPGRS